MGKNEYKMSNNFHIDHILDFSVCVFFTHGSWKTLNCLWGSYYTHWAATLIRTSSSFAHLSRYIRSIYSELCVNQTCAPPPGAYRLVHACLRVPTAYILLLGDVMYQSSKYVGTRPKALWNQRQTTNKWKIKKITVIIISVMNKYLLWTRSYAWQFAYIIFLNPCNSSVRECDGQFYGQSD